jgi:NSS family neurotransmitter:Na+ symporter
MVENRGMKRPKAAALAGLLAWVMGIGSVLSFNLWSDVKLFDETYFGIVDFLSTKIMLPLGGLLIAIFSVWMMSKKASIEELNMGEGIAYSTWYFVIRYIAPVGVILVFLHVIGLI